MSSSPGSGPSKGPDRSSPAETPPDPRVLKDAIELARAAFVQAMREHGLDRDTYLAIAAEAEANIVEALDADVESEDDPQPGDS